MFGPLNIDNSCFTISLLKKSLFLAKNLQIKYHQCSKIFWGTVQKCFSTWFYFWVPIIAVADISINHTSRHLDFKMEIFWSYLSPWSSLISPKFGERRKWEWENEFQWHSKVNCFGLLATMLWFMSNFGQMHSIQQVQVGQAWLWM